MAIREYGIGCTLYCKIYYTQDNIENRSIVKQNSGNHYRYIIVIIS